MNRKITATLLTATLVLGGGAMAACETTTESPTTNSGQSEKSGTADAFKTFVAKNGTANEKAAVEHVTKVQGADDGLGLAEVHTDFTGGMMGGNADSGKLIASAFAEWKSTDDNSGLVTVYDASGEILSNGNY